MNYGKDARLVYQNDDRRRRPMTGSDRRKKKQLKVNFRRNKRINNWKHKVKAKKGKRCWTLVITRTLVKKKTEKKKWDNGRRKMMTEKRR